MELCGKQPVVIVVRRSGERLIAREYIFFYLLFIGPENGNVDD